MGMCFGRCKSPSVPDGSENGRKISKVAIRRIRKPPLASPLSIQQQAFGRDRHSNSYPDGRVQNPHQPPPVSSSVSSLVPRSPQTEEHQMNTSSRSAINLGQSQQSSDPITAILRVSSRFTSLDIYVQFRPHPFWYDITAVQVRKSNEINWMTVNYEETVPKFRLITVELDPFTTYQVRCLLRVTSRQGQRPTPVTTTAAAAETGRKLESLPGYVAIRDFEQRVPSEVSFNKGDILQRVPSHLLPEEGVADQYSFVRNCETDESGLAPNVCLRPVDALTRPAVARHQSYFFATADRRRAAIMLMRPNIANGVFLMRPSADSSAENCIALSVRAGVENGVPSLAKFKIYYLSDGYGCFIYPTKTFEDIEDLVDYYRKTPIQNNVLLTDAFVPPDDPARPPTLDDIRIPKSSIEYGEKLGNGKFGNVFKGKLKHLDVAVKELIMPECDNAEDALSPDLILEEALVMAGLFHDNIVKLIAVCVDSAPYCLISEYMNIGSLKKYLTLPEVRRSMEFDRVLYILLQIASGMAYLESKTYIHRDLRADNVLVHQEPGGSLEVRIADFGLSRLVPEGVYVSTSRLLPIRWTAPEALTSLNFTLKSDVWSFGILAFEVVSFGAMPYPSIRSNSDAQRSIQAGVIMSLEECQSIDASLCPETLYNVIKSCWHMEPEKRAEFASLKSTFEHFETAIEGQYLQ